MSALAIAAGCSGGGGSPRARPASGRWVVSAATFEASTSSSADGANPEIQRVIAVRGGWAAMGSLGGRGLAAWRSSDGVHWRSAKLLHTATNVFSGVSVIVKRGTDFVAAGSSNQHPAIWVSRDDGSSWSRVVADALGGDGTIYGATVAHDAVALVGSRGTGETTLTPAAWIVRGVAHVDRAVVPRSPGVQNWMTGIVDSGTGLVSVGEVNGRPAVWRSSDDGATWKRLSISAAGAGGGMQQVVRLRGGLLASGAYYVSGGNAAAGFVFQASADATSWQPVRRRSGAFGDGEQTQVYQLIAFRNAAMMIGVAHDRTDPNFCYDKLASCDQDSPTLWLSTNGRTWGRVAVDQATRSDRYTTVAADSSGFLVVGARYLPTSSASTPRVWRWIGSANALPMSEVPVDERPEKPGHQLITHWDARLDVGRTYRFPVPIGGGCGAGRLYFNATTWQVVHPWGEAPYPKSWPVRHEAVSDAPTDYLYGTVRVVDRRHLDVGIEDGPTLRTYTPTKQRTGVCG